MTYGLKEAREQAGLALEDVVRKLKIRRSYLIALEEGKPEEIPGEVYAQGYLKMYSNYLGLEILQSASVTLPTSSGFWTKPERLAQYGTYKVILSLSLIGILCIFCWQSLQEYDQEQGLVGKLGEYSAEEESSDSLSGALRERVLIQNEGPNHE